MTDDAEPTQRCTYCGQTKPLTRDYYYWLSRVLRGIRTYRFSRRCKLCRINVNKWARDDERREKLKQPGVIGRRNGRGVQITWR